MRIKFRYIIPFTIFLLISGCAQEKPQPGIKSTEETSLPVVSKEPEKTETSGTCGNMNWTLSKDRVLTIGGTGKIDGGDLFYSIENEAGWDDDDFEDVKRIIITDEITELNWRLGFDDFVNLESVEMSDSVQKIGSYAFSNCWKLKEIKLSPNITQIGKDAFMDCPSLKKIVLPEKLEKYNKNAIKYCTSLDEIENRSSHTWKLLTKHVAGRWFCDGKEVDELPPGKTATIRSIKYPITYNLSGGVATGKLPTTYDSRKGCKIPKNVKREGWALVNWHFDGGLLKDTIEPGEEGARKVTALWIKFRLNRMKNGKIRADIELEPFNGPYDDYPCIVRYSRNKDMSDYEVLVPYSEDYDHGGVLEEMKKGKRYYVEYAVLGADLDFDGDVSWDDFPWQGKQEITCG